MKILNAKSEIPQNVSLIMGFFDGVHAGHRNVIKNTFDNIRVVVTFSSSPALFFNKPFDYIYSRTQNYEILETLGVDYIYEQNFADIANISAEKYIGDLIKLFNPKSITTGFNHTFGAGKLGNPAFLEKRSESYRYFCTPATIIEGNVVSSTNIRKLLMEGSIEQANKLLVDNFKLEATVIHGAKIGRQLGFPTANMKYPERIIKIPYGVYKVKVLDKFAIMNWGIKPTIGSEEVIYIHIPNFDKDLYGETLKFEIVSKIRDEKKFDNLEDLKSQIKKDIELCLKS